MVETKKALTLQKRIIIAVILSVLGGVLLFLAYPPVNLWPMIFIVMVPLAVAQFRFMPLKWAPLAPAITNTIFLWPYLARIFGIPDAPFFFRHMGLFFGLAALLMSTERKLHERTQYKWFVLQGMFAWVGFEMIRGLIPVLGTMGFVGNTLATQAWLIQPISIFSIYGLNLVIILVNYTIAYFALRWVDAHYAFDDTVAVNPAHTYRWAIICLVVCVLWVGGSLFMYNDSLDTPTIKVAALHSYFEGPGHMVDDAELARRFETISSQARDAAQQGAQVIFMPEMEFGFDPREEYTIEFKALAQETSAYLYIVYALHDEQDGWHNETILLSPDGEFTNHYGKLHAFGEPPTVTRGTFPVEDTSLGNLGSIICMDGVFTDAARYVAGNGAQVLGIPTHNATVGISEHNWTHFVMRSVENRVPVVNADRGLVSMITDARGDVRAFARTPQGGFEVLVAEVQVGAGNSLYPLVGDWMGWVALAGFVFFTVYQIVLDSRDKRLKKSK